MLVNKKLAFYTSFMEQRVSVAGNTGMNRQSVDLA